MNLSSKNPQMTFTTVEMEPSLNKTQLKEVIEVVDGRFNELKMDVEKKLDIILLGDKEEWAAINGLREETQSHFINLEKAFIEINATLISKKDKYKFHHDKKTALWVGIASFLSSLLGLHSRNIIELFLVS